METLAKAAVVEISRLWEDGFTLVQVELRRKENEIEALTRKLMLMENERLTVLTQAHTTNLSSSSSSKREQQNKLLPPTGDGKNRHWTDNNLNIWFMMDLITYKLCVYMRSVAEEEFGPFT